MKDDILLEQTWSIYIVLHANVWCKCGFHYFATKSPDVETNKKTTCMYKQYQFANCTTLHVIFVLFFLGVMLDVAEVHNKIENVKKPPVALEDKTIPVIAVSDNVHCPNIPPNATKYIGKLKVARSVPYSCVNNVKWVLEYDLNVYLYGK